MAMGFIAVLSIGFGVHGFAAEKTNLPEFLLRGWDREDGLPLAVAQASERTPDGYLWVATDQGLVRFDGDRFVVFTTNSTPALADNRITCLLLDQSGDLWVGTDAGTLARRHEGSFARVKVDPGLRNRGISSLAQAPDGAIWLATKGAGLMRICAGSCAFFNTNNGLPADVVSRVLTDHRGQLWAVAGGKLVQFEDGRWQIAAVTRELTRIRAIAPGRTNGVWIATTETEDSGARVFRLSDGGALEEFGPYPWPQDALRSMVDVLWEDTTGRLWVGTFGGGVFHRRRGEAWQRLTGEGPLSQNIVTGFTEDEEGSFWLTLENGQLFQARRRLVTTLRLPPPHGDVAVKAGCATRDGSLWIGTEGAGVFRYRDGEVHRFGQEAGLGSGKIGVIYEDRQTNLWVGTWDGLYQLAGDRFEPKLRQASPPLVVLSLHEDSQSNLWVGTVYGIVRLKGGELKEFAPLGNGQYQEVRAIVEDKEGRIWASLCDRGLFRLEGSEFKAYAAGQWAGEGSTRRVFADADGALWITTWGRGLFRLSGGKFTQWTAQDGLPSDTLQALTESADGKLWIGSVNGIYGCTKTAMDQFVRGQSPPLPGWHLSVADGMEDRFCSGVGEPAVTRSADGRLWFPNQRALAVFDPAQVVQRAASPLLPLVEEFWVDGTSHPFDLTRELRVKSGARRIEFHYTLPNFQMPERLRFRYRLVGYDPDWVDAERRRVAYYGQLPPGHYEFQVMAGGSDGVWRKAGAGAHLEVVPAFWERHLVQALATVLMVGGLGAVVRIRALAKLRRRLQQLEAQEALANERRRIAQDIHDDLGSSLTRIAWLSELAAADKATPAKVEAHTSKIAQYARQMVKSMDEIVWAVNPRNDSLQSLVQYVTYYANETFEPTSVNCRLEVPPDLPPLVLSSDARHDLFLAVKEGLSNILKHAAATEVRFRFAAEGGVLTLVLEDNGRGFDAETQRQGRRGQGLQNLRRRIEGLGGMFDCKSAPGQGTRLTFVIKLRVSQEEAA